MLIKASKGEEAASRVKGPPHAPIGVEQSGPTLLPTRPDEVRSSLESRVSEVRARCCTGGSLGEVVGRTEH